VQFGGKPQEKEWSLKPTKGSRVGHSVPGKKIDFFVVT
jgi:hypothetical protein